MKKRKNLSLAIFFLVGTSLIIFSVGCGTDKKEPIGSHGTQAATVGLDVCTSCHFAQTEDWMTSGHANVSPVSDLNSTGTPSYGDFSDSTCETCHDPLADGQRLTGNYTGNVPRPVVGCESCHGGGSEHYGGGPIGLLGSAASDEIGSSQFNTCTGCHELLNSSGTGTAVASHSTDTSAWVIIDTHFATAGTYSYTSALRGANTSTVTGYSMDYASELVCVNCHNPHTANIAINKEWAGSAHADTTPAGAWAHYDWTCNYTSCQTPPSPAFAGDRRACQRCHTTTGLIAYVSNPAAYDPFTNPPLAYTGQYKPEMLKCTGCHTDFKGSLRNPGAITADYDVFTSYPTSTYPPATYAVVNYAYPDASNSNLCMACHTGRENGDSIKQLNLQTYPTVSFDNLSFINSHYLAAGGTVFTATGYEYSTRDYSSYPTPYMHDKIGSSATIVDTGTKGPCIGCHMSFTQEKHRFLPVSEPSGTITAVTSTVCGKCHFVSPEMLENRKELLHEALEALKYQLELRGYYFYEAHPYFYKLRDRTGVGNTTASAAAVVIQDDTIVTGVTTSWFSGPVSAPTTTVKAGDFFRLDSEGTYYKIKQVNNDTQITLDSPYSGLTASGAYTIIQGGSTGAVKNWLTQTAPAPFAVPDTDSTGDKSGKNNMGAAFNFNLLEHDPGAFVHNRYYTKRLIYDAIDWLDNNNMDYSVGGTLDALDGIKYPFKTEAMHYLLPNGVTGNEVERP